MSAVRGRVPTTDEIRSWATYVPDGTIGMHISERDAAAFDLWLEAFRAEIRAGLVAKVQAAVDAYGYTDYADGHEFRAIDCDTIIEALTVVPSSGEEIHES